MAKRIDWEAAAMELCRRLAKFEYLAAKNKKINYVPSGAELPEISVKAVEIYTDVTTRHSK